MVRVTLQDVTTEYKGEQIAGRYLVDKGTVVVFYAGLRKATQTAPLAVNAGGPRSSVLALS
jgi:hypothetical protein